MLRKYDRKNVLREVIRRTIVESRIEYKFLGLDYDPTGADEYSISAF